MDTVQSLLTGGGDAALRVARIRRAVIVFAAIELLCSLVVLVFGCVEASRGRRMYRTIVSGSVGVACGLLGIAAALRRDEALMRLFFVLQMWSLATVTSHIYLAMETQRASMQVCTPRANFATDGSTVCRGRVERDTFKLLFSFLAVLVTVVSAMVSLECVDALNDYNATYGEPEASGGVDEQSQFEARVAAASLPGNSGAGADLDKVDAAVDEAVVRLQPRGAADGNDSDSSAPSLPPPRTDGVSLPGAVTSAESDFQL